MKHKKFYWDNKKGLFSYNLRPYKKKYKNEKIKVLYYSFCYKITIGGIISDEHHDTQTSKRNLIYKLLYQTPPKIRVCVYNILKVCKFCRPFFCFWLSLIFYY